MPSGDSRPLSLWWRMLPKSYAERGEAVREAGFEKVCGACGRVAEMAAAGTLSAEFVATEVLRPLKELSESSLYPSEAARRTLVEALLAALSASGCDYAHAAACCDAIDKLLRSRNPATEREHIPGLKVDAGALLDYCDRVWFAKTRLRRSLPSNVLEGPLGRVFMKVSVYFTAADAEAVWSRLRPRICHNDQTGLNTAWSLLLHMLPVRLVTQEQVDDICALSALSTSLTHTEEVLFFLRRLADAQISPGVLGKPAASVLPHVTTIHARVLKALRAGSQETGGLLHKGRKHHTKAKERTAAVAGQLVAALAALQWNAGDTSLQHLTVLLRAFDRFLGPCDDKGDLLVLNIARGLTSQIRKVRSLDGGAARPLLCLDDNEWRDEESDAGGDEGEDEDAGDEDDTDLPFVDMRAKCVSVLLPCCLTMLMNQRSDGVTSNGARLAQALMYMDPDQAFPAVLDRAKRNSAVKTSSIGKKPLLYKTLLPQVLRRGAQEDQQWLLGQIAELLDPAHSKSIAAAMNCLLVICAATPLTGWLAEWGADVGRRLLRLCDVIDMPSFFTLGSQLLAAAMQPPQREEFCDAVLQYCQKRVHAPEPAKNIHLVAISGIAGGCAAACPEWGERLAEALRQRALGADAADGEGEAAVQFSAHVLAKVSRQLGPRLVPHLDKQIEVVEKLFAADSDKKWRIAAGGAVLKQTMRSLTELRAPDLSPGEAELSDGAVRPRGVSVKSVQVQWVQPSDADLDAARSLYARYAPSVLRRIADTKRWGADGGAHPADAARLKYLIKGACVLLRDDLVAGSDDPVAKALAQHCIRTHDGKVSWSEVAKVLGSAPVHSAAGCTDRIGVSLVRAVSDLLHNQCFYRNRQAMVHLYGAASVRRLAGGVVAGRKELAPLCALQALRVAWRADFLVDAAARRPEECELITPLVEMAASVQSAVRDKAVSEAARLVTRNTLPRDGVHAVVRAACKHVQSASGEGASHEVEQAAIGGLKLLQGKDMQAAVWRHWDLLHEVALTLLRAGIGAKETLVKESAAAFTKMFNGSVPQSMPAAEGRFQALISELIKAADGASPTEIMRVCVALDALTRAMPERAAVPEGTLTFLLIHLADGQKKARESCRRALMSSMLRSQWKPPRRTVGSMDICTTARIPVPVKVYDYAGAAGQSQHVGEVLRCLDDAHLHSLLTIDEENINDKLEELKEVKSTFSWDAANVWKGVFQLAGAAEGLALINRLKEHRAMSTDALGSGNGRQQAELVGGLLRAMRHWKHSGSEAACAAGWELALERLAAVVGGKKLTDWKNFGEALCFVALDRGSETPLDLKPLVAALLHHLESAAGPQSECRVVALIGRFLGGVSARPVHIAVTHSLLDAFMRKELQLEYEQVRREVCVLNAYLFQIFSRMPGKADEKMTAWLESLDRGDRSGALVVLGSVSSTGSLGRIVGIEPYLGQIVQALVRAVTIKQSHADDGDLSQYAGAVVRAFLLGGFNLTPLITMLGLIPADQLAQKRGRKLLIAAAELVAVSAFDALTERSVQEALQKAINPLLQGILADAAKDAAHAIASIARVADDRYRDVLAAEYTEWSRSEQVKLRKAAAGGLAGLVAPRTYNADAKTFELLQVLLELTKDDANPVRLRSSEFAAGWREAVRENPVVWALIQPELESRCLKQPLLSVQSAAAASFAFS